MPQPRERLSGAPPSNTLDRSSAARDHNASTPAPEHGSGHTRTTAHRPPRLLRGGLDDPDRWLTRDEASRVLCELPQHLAEMMRFSLATGLRERNVTYLEWSQVDLRREVAWIHPDQAKSRRAISIPLNAEALQVLRRQSGKHPTRVFTFNGRPVGKANTRAWRRALRRAEVEDFRWHDLRHTWASWLVQVGTPLHVLQELGGWNSVQMVQRYAHLSADHLAGYAEKLPGLGTDSGTLAGAGTAA